MPIGNGGIIGPANVPTLASAKGVWSLREAQLAQRQGIWPLGLIPDPYFEYTTLLLPGNGTNGAQNNTFLDASTNNFTITRNGNTTQGTFSPFSQTGWGNYFNGSSNLQLASNSDFQPGTGNFTIEAWVNFSANNSMIIAVYNQGCAFYVKSTGYLAFAQDSVAERLVAGTAFPLNQWNHVAVVRNSTTLTIYQNGVSVGTTSNSDNLTGTTVTVGSGNAISQPSTGYISNFRFVKGQALFTGSFTPAILPINSTTVGSTGAGVPTQTITGTVALLTCQSNRFIDNSPTPKTITLGGSPSVQAFSPFNPLLPWTAANNGGSGYFDKSGDYLSITNTSALAFGTGDFTVEFWQYLTVANAAGTGMGFIGGTSGSGNFGMSTDFINVYAFTIGGAGLAFSYVPKVNRWTHYAFVRSSGSASLYVDGVRIGSPQSYTTNITGLSGSTLIGAEGGPTNYFAGYFSGLRYVNGTALYSGTSFTPPTAPPTAISGTSLLLNFTNAGIYDATSKNDLETVGNAQISTTQSKFGGSSMVFDGTGDYLFRPSSDFFTFQGDFTIEFWMYSGSYASTGLSFPTMFATTTYTGTGIGIKMQDTNGYGAVWYNTTQIITGTTNLANSSWNHIALTRSGSTIRFFVNGTLQGTPATNSNTFTTTGLLIGADDPTRGYFNGYLDDLRVTKGYARYTANFTAPTAPFPLQ